MKISLKTSEHSKLERLEQTRRNNFRFADLISGYLNLFPTFVKPEYTKELMSLLSATAEQAFSAALSVALGLESEDPQDRIIIRKYMSEAFKQLSVDDYSKNSYYRNVIFSGAELNGWQLTRKTLLPWEGFVYNDPIVKDDFTEIPRIGFFTESFEYPAVLEKGREWMTLMPNETATLENAINNCFGNTVTYGLGLGYFPYMASAKENVKTVTVVERDKNVIELFKKNLLPCFPYKEKIRVVCQDAFSHLETVDSGNCDYILADIWHDAGDGLPLYLRFRDAAKHKTGIKWDYWLEDTMLCYLRWPWFSEIYAAFKTGTDPDIFPELEINCYEDLCKILSLEFIKDHACEIGRLLKVSF